MIINGKNFEQRVCECKRKNKSRIVKPEFIRVGDLMPALVAELKRRKDES